MVRGARREPDGLDPLQGGGTAEAASGQAQETAETGGLFQERRH